MEATAISDQRTIWILTDGKAGDRIQCLGVAERLGGVIEERVVKPGRMWSLSPRALLPWKDRPNNPESPIAPPYPDVVIASGRKAHPYLQAIKKAAGDKVFTVFLKDPRVGSSAADLTWVPVHDQLRNKNVIVTLTSPHPLTTKVLEEARTSAEVRFADYPGIRIGLVLGGTTRGVSWDDETCERFAQRLAQLPAKGHVVLAIASRRTPPQLQVAVKEALKNHPLFFWNGEDGSENPYRQILALSDRLIVTGDSHNMVSEALAPGVPTFVFRPHGLKPKLHQFLDDLQDHRMMKNFEGSVEEFPSWPIDSTGEIADAIKKALEGHH